MASESEHKKLKYSIVLRSNILAHVNDYATLYYSIFSLSLLGASTRITPGKRKYKIKNNNQRMRNKVNGQELSSKIANAHITMMLTTLSTAGTLIKILTFSRSTRNFSRRKYVQTHFRQRISASHTYTSPHSLSVHGNKSH